MQCPQCQHENREGAKFCAACGNSFAITCGSCGNRNLPGAAFCDHCGISLIGSSLAPSPAQSMRHDTGTRLYLILPEVSGLLRREGRVTYRHLTQLFALDKGLLKDVGEELIFRGVARDQDGKGLVWTGETQPVIQPEVSRASPAARPEATEYACRHT